MEDGFSKIIGRNLRGLRIKHGYTQKQIAAVLCVSFQQIQKYETGQNRLPIEKMILLKSLYDIPLEAFFISIRQAMDGQQERALYRKRADRILHRLSHMPDQSQQARIFKVLDILLEG